MAHSRSASGPGATLAQIVHHDQYYLRGGDVTFLVENTLFRVHRYFFERESPYFHAKLCTPVSPGQNPIGTSDQNAFSLDGVKSTDFARFLWVFYNPKYSLYSTTVEEWKSILRLAHEWSFAEVKNLVVRELEKMVIADIPKIVIYHSYDVERTYLLPNYAALCAREDPITLHEGRELGLETVLRVAEARERLRRNGPRSPTGAEFPAVDLQAIVCEIFEISPPSPSSSTADASFRLVNGNSAAPAVTPAPASTSYVTPSSFSSFSANPQAPRAANGAATVGNSLFNSVFNTGASNGTAPPSAQLTSPRQQPTSPKQQPTSPFTRPTSPPAAPLSVSIAPAATGDEPSGAAPPSALPTGTTAEPTALDRQPLPEEKATTTTTICLLPEEGNAATKEENKVETEVAKQEEVKVDEAGSVVAGVKGVQGDAGVDGAGAAGGVKEASDPFESWVDVHVAKRSSDIEMDLTDMSEEFKDP